MATDPTTLDPIRHDLPRWQDKLQSGTIEVDTYRLIIEGNVEVAQLLM